MSGILIKTRTRIPVRVCPETGRKVLAMYLLFPNKNLPIVIPCRQAVLDGGKCPKGRRYVCEFNFGDNGGEEVEICLEY